ncbi:protein of unknown function [Sterolibacterium denitrificans]|uniref:HTH iclR-type domain-containing protein n=1 Tax=Sterolibacterium denitrificans TaxID=157592 RepID=A0A7Z7MUY0_9PROT|nr:hypothetical protein [Sterolibacterium denitrificans]SMB24833.1 protein of unknown function [Sterolibacterium denitrificans]
MTIDRKVFDQNFYRVSYLLSRFMVPYMRSVYREFDGDILLNIVIGEIGTRNLGQFYEASRNSKTFESRLGDVNEHRRVLRPCNALSISDASGIPRETVRRKVNVLIERGWVSQNERGHLYLTPEVAKHFQRFLLLLIEELLPAAQELAEVLEQPPIFPESRSTGKPADTD